MCGGVAAYHWLQDSLLGQKFDRYGKETSTLELCCAVLNIDRATLGHSATFAFTIHNGKSRPTALAQHDKKQWVTSYVKLLSSYAEQS